MFRFTHNTLNTKSASIYSMLWKDKNIIMTGNYDSTLRMIDTRINEEVHQWLDSYDSAIFSLDFDGLNGVVCGQNYHCRVTLYDLRIPGKFIQMYYPKMEYSNRGSPVYGITCDASHLFVATDHNLRILDFNADWAAEKNYQDFYTLRD